MVANKHVSKIIIALMAIAVILSLLAVVFSDKILEKAGGTGVKVEYETKLFNTDEIISIDILMDDDTWNEMLENAMSENYYSCDVVINGTKFYNVAIRPKGNTSLSAIAMDPDSDRYSLKLEFGHFTEGQTCFGLDKLILNNNYADATNMKEAVIYDMYQYLGADASLYNYASVSRNGEYQGVYLALEAVEQSFMLRNYGAEDGEIYKPESMGMGGGDSKFGKDSSKGSGKSSRKDSGKDNGKSDGKDPKGGFSFGGKDGFSMGGNGGSNLNYTDDDLDSYSTIWEGEITKTGEKDHKRVVKALKNISEGNDLEKYLDVDNVLKYMAVHTFAVNNDSLSGNMAHNYYLYEAKGKLNIIPWDYNLSFGGMSMGSSGDATEMINDAIDTPFSGTEFFDALLENDEYRAKYHEYLQMLVDEYVNGGKFVETYTRIRSRIDSLVETDPTAFYDYDEYQVAADYLYKTIKLRAESIEGQLNGTIPSTDEGQREDSSSFVDGSEIDVKAMGQFNMGGMGGNDRDFKKQPEKRGGFNPGQGFHPGGGFNPFDGNNPSGDGDNGNTGLVDFKSLAVYGIYLAVLVAALVVVIVVKRRR